MLQLSSNELRILSAVQLHADLSTAEVARLSKTNERTARYALNRLQERGSIVPYPLIDLSQIGWCELGIYLTLAPSSRAQYAAATEQLCSLPWVSAVTEFAGASQLCVDIQAQSIDQAFEHVTALHHQLPTPITTRHVIVRSQRTVFQRKFFGSSKAKNQCITLGGSPQPRSLDQQDLKILSLLRSSNPLERGTLARRLHLPRSTLEYRIARLQEWKIIRGFAYAVIALKLDLRVYRLLLSSQPKRENTYLRMATFASQHPRVVTLVRGVGSWDYEMRVEFDDPKGITTFYGELAEALPGEIRTIETLTFLGTRKMTHFSP